ncbi:type 4 pilus major pilin [Pseudomonas kitaguniensis]|uniref:type 4 pilus major pilin n=1 Tax=Pseudomonas kitaguniensis TaxID=2607908 RepID=UPI003B9EEF38
MHNTQFEAMSGQRLRDHSTPDQALGLKSKKQAGYSLVELAVVILVIGLLAGVAAMVLPGIFASFRANKITDEFNQAIPAIQTAYQNRTSFSGLTTAQVAQNRWVGGGMTEVASGVPTGNLLTQWGQLTFAPASNGTQGQGTLTNIPSRECIKISNAMMSDQYLNVNINGASVKSGSTDLDLTAVGTQCNSSNANTIVFTFGRA